MDLYGELTDFNLPQVAMKRPGLGWDAERISLSGLELSYRHLSVLRLLGAREARYAGLVPPRPGCRGSSGGVRLFDFPVEEPLQPFLASVRFTDRNYLVGAKVAASGRSGPRLDRFAGPRCPHGPRPACAGRLHQLR